MDSRLARGPQTVIAQDSWSLLLPAGSALCDHLMVDVSALAQHRANTLIIGDPCIVGRVLSAVWPSLKKSVQWMTGTRLVLPVETGGTLILEEGDGLNGRAQADLMGWLDGRGRSVCLVTTSMRPLYPLVDAGLFLEALYYRLNQMLIEVGSFPR
jgi:hypothetical protein